MKNLVFLSFCLLVSFAVQGQVEQENRAMSKGSQPALSMVIIGSEVKFVETAWKDYTKNYGRIAKAKGSQESVIEGAQILSIGGVNKLNLYADADPVSGGTKVYMWIEMAGGFINEKDFQKEYKEAATFLKEFGHKVEVEQIELDLLNQQKALTKFQGDMTKLQNENASMQKTIETAKLKIADTELQVTANLEEQAAAQKLIDDQKLMLEAIQKKLDETKAKKPN